MRKIAFASQEAIPDVTAVPWEDVEQYKGVTIGCSRAERTQPEGHGTEEAQGAARYRKISCEACDFDFATLYGDLGNGFAECHHTMPLFELTANHPTRLADLAILCANCHRMIHKSRPMLSVPGLRALIADRRT